MPQTTEESLADLVIELVSDRPLSGFEIARALEDRYQLALRGREGGLYAALLKLEQDGFLEGFWVDMEDGTRRRRYRLPVLDDLRWEADG
jgi:DNA-binding PadR family transcriptional regulator